MYEAATMSSEHLETAVVLLSPNRSKGDFFKGVEETTTAINKV